MAKTCRVTKNKVMKDAHIDPHKFGKRLGEHISREVSKFSDKEIEEAMKIGMLIGNRLEPEDGVSYEEVAALLWADENNLSFEGIPEEYTKDDVYIPKIDRLLHVLKQVMFDFLLNTTLEPHETEDSRKMPLLPVVKETKRVRFEGKITTYDEPIKMIFNGASKKNIPSTN